MMCPTRVSLLSKQELHYYRLGCLRGYLIRMKKHYLLPLFP